MKRIISFTVVTLLGYGLLFLGPAQAETELPLTASASSSYWSYTPNNAVDNNLSTFWQGARTSSWWLSLDCAKVYPLSKISIWWNATYGVSNYDIQSSQDATNWSNVYTGLNSGTGSNPKLVTYSLSVNARYIRLYIRSVPFFYPQIYEVKIYASEVNQSPTASANANPTSGPAPLTVQFSGSGSDPDGTIVSYSWNFGDGGTSTEQNPTHTYNNPGTYTAKLTVTDNKGATGSDSVVISVIAEIPEGIPHLLRFQGRLTDKENKPLSGAYNIAFRIYKSETGGTPEWSETHTNIQINNGIVNLLLGSINPVDLKFDRHYWLSTEIGSDGEMQPRQRITSVGYTYRAEFAQKGGTAVYTTQAEISKTLSTKLSLHLENLPSSVKLYIWGEAQAEAGYPNGLTVKIDGVDRSAEILSLANANWGRNETKLGDGTAAHPLCAGAGTVTGTGALDITNLAAWSAGEHTIEFSHSSTTKAKIRCNAYTSY